MPFKEYGNQNNYKTTPALPDYLAHKPVYAIPYKKFDGMYGKGTDARYISVGLSQWDSEDISLKIMRHTGEKWTRQAEELPLHRVIDASIFLTKVLLDSNSDSVEFERDLFLNQKSGIRVEKESIAPEQQENYDAFLEKHTDLLKERLKSLYLTLDGLNKQGKL